MLLVAYWTTWTLGWLWRRSIWERIALQAKGSAGHVRPLWMGWRVQTQTLRIDWVGGLRGLRTRVKKGDRTWVQPGLLTVDEIRRLSK